METLTITATDKAGIYEEILPQIKAITEGESDIIANAANIAAILKEAFGFFWVGFYFVKHVGESNLSAGNDEAELVLGPFQGPLACTRIKYGRGVCGAAWKEARTLVVPDVDAFPGHIACSSLSRSEIVVPVYSASHSDGDNVENKIEKTDKIKEPNKIIAVLDIDSKELSAFDQTDAFYLEQLVQMIG